MPHTGVFLMIFLNYVYSMCFCVGLVPGLVWAEMVKGESCFNKRKSLSAAFKSVNVLTVAEELNNTLPGM